MSEYVPEDDSPEAQAELEHEYQRLRFAGEIDPDGSLNNKFYEEK